MAATVVWGVATEVPAQRQSPPEENKASAAGAETPGRAADAGQRDKHPATNGQNRMGSSVADSRDRWLLRGSRKKGFEHLGLDSEGTGRQRVNLLQQPARLEFDDPEEQLRLPDAWTVFAPVYFDDPAPAACELRSLPERLELAGRPLTRKRARPDGARLDLAPLIGGTMPKVGALVYIPFSLDRDEEVAFGFGADWWLQAWIDGREVCTTFPPGNRTFPPTAFDQVHTVALAQGEHLLVIRFASGTATSHLHLSARRRLWATEREIDDGRWRCTRRKTDGSAAVAWELARAGDTLDWSLRYAGPGTVSQVRLILPFNAMVTPTVLLPARIGDGGVSFGPWLLVAPDFGHLKVEAEGRGDWQATMEGKRGGGLANRHSHVMPPTEREGPSREHVARLGYLPQTLDLVFCLTSPLRDGDRAGLKLSPVELTKPAGLDAALWKRIRRPYLNQWQPSSNWTPRKDEWMLLGNNALSDVAPACAFYYGEPMLFWDEIVPGIKASALLRSTVDHALHCHVARDGHCISFFDHEIHFCANPCFIIAAWQYWKLSRDREWLSAHLAVLHRIGDFLARRDVDLDGLVESWNAGNAGTLREPDRADVYYEFTNFGWKNAYSNAFIYKAWRCLAEMLAAGGHPNGAGHYLALAEKLRQAYVAKLLNPATGWFAGWVSADGAMHDYGYTFVNGMAVAYGLVSPAEGRVILERLVRKSHEIGFTAWRCGVPMNLIPVSQADWIQPSITLDGQAAPEAAGAGEVCPPFGFHPYNGGTSGALTWPYLLGLQTAGLNEEADRILNAMLGHAEAGLFQNGIVNSGGSGAEFHRFDGRTTGYEGYLPEVWNFLMAAFTRNPAMRGRLLGSPEAPTGE
jgi:hypothetical protein